MGDGNCGIYAAMEGLLNCNIKVKTDVNLFRKEVHDYIGSNMNNVLSNFSFSGKILPDGRTRGKKKEEWLTNDVMARIWAKGSKYKPVCPHKH